MFVIISDNGPAGEAIESFLRRRGIPFERATERFAEQFPASSRPSVIAGARCFEGIAGAREAAHLHLLGHLS